MNPHVEVYVGTNAKYPESRYAGYVVGGKPQGQIPGGDINAACLNYGDVPKATATVVGGVTYRSKIGLRCTFSGAGVMDLIERPKEARVLLFHRGKRILLRADATPTKASVTVPKGACTRQPLPH